MMKKIIPFLLATTLFIYCSEDDNSGNFTLKDLPVDSYTVPDSFTFGKKDTIAVTYTLPDGCHSFNNLFYQIQDSARIVAIRAFVDLDGFCTTAAITEEYKFTVVASQKEDYVFKFFVGVDDDGENIFEEVTVPVN